MIKCGVANKPAVSRVNVLSSSSDGSTRATSRELGKRKQKELEEVQSWLMKTKMCIQKITRLLLKYICLSRMSNARLLTNLKSSGVMHYISLSTTPGR